MKSFITLSAIAIMALTSCNTKNANNIAFGEYEILTGYPWVLGSEKLETYDQLNDSIYSTIDETNSFTNIALKHPKVKIKYSYSPDGINLKQDSIVLIADNKQDFSAKELIFKINNATLTTLKGNSHVFFEGLEYDRFENETPVYWILQGS